LLPYHLTDSQRQEADYTDAEQILAQDQRDGWWRRYGEVAGQPLDGMPDELKKLESLQPITAEPLLNHLVSLSRKSGFVFDESTNRNSIYANLLQQVWERRHDPRPRPPAGLRLEHFVRLLEEIALAAWHGGESRVTTRKAIHQRCEQARLVPILEEVFPKNVEAGIVSLLLAFYFRQSKERVGDDATFEFTHKSFGEYLLANRLIRTLRELHQNDEQAVQGR